MKLTKTLCIFALYIISFTTPVFALNKFNLEPILTYSTSFVVFPQDCNANFPMLFGGKILSEMDRCAAVTARRFLYNSPTGAKDYVTVAINNVKFLKSAEVKDLLFITGQVNKVGTKSINIKVVMQRETKDGCEDIAEGEFVFVAYDVKEKRAIEHGLKLAEK